MFDHSQNFLASATVAMLLLVNSKFADAGLVQNMRFLPILTNEPDGDNKLRLSFVGQANSECSNAVCWNSFPDPGVFNGHSEVLVAMKMASMMKSRNYQACSSVGLDDGSPSLLSLCEESPLEFGAGGGFQGSWVTLKTAADDPDQLATCVMAEAEETCRSYLVPPSDAMLECMTDTGMSDVDLSVQATSSGILKLHGWNSTWRSNGACKISTTSPPQIITISFIDITTTATTNFVSITSSSASSSTTVTSPWPYTTSSSNGTAASQQSSMETTSMLSSTPSTTSALSTTTGLPLVTSSSSGSKINLWAFFTVPTPPSGWTIECSATIATALSSCTAFPKTGAQGSMMSFSAAASTCTSLYNSGLLVDSNDEGIYDSLCKALRTKGATGKFWLRSYLKDCNLADAGYVLNVAASGDCTVPAAVSVSSDTAQPLCITKYANDRSPFPLSSVPSYFVTQGAEKRATPSEAENLCKVYPSWLFPKKYYHVAPLNAADLQKVAADLSSSFCPFCLARFWFKDATVANSPYKVLRLGLKLGASNNGYEILDPTAGYDDAQDDRYPTGVICEKD